MVGPQLRDPVGSGTAIVNLIDHCISLQEAVEAPRVFAKGPVAEVEAGYGAALIEGLRQLGHPARAVDSVAGCIAAVAVEAEGRMTGANCWRGNGAPAGIGGGPARPGIIFGPDPT